MVYTHKAFVQQYPGATKRVLRAILKAADLCTSEPERAARFLVEKGYTTHYAYARETIQDVVYRQWREYNPEDTVRFYALRMQEAGMLRSTPQKLIAQGTDWRFFNALKKELKG
jgi:NitT/TauT family transport system substrate-binding protein